MQIDEEELRKKTEKVNKRFEEAILTQDKKVIGKLMAESFGDPTARFDKDVFMCELTSFLLSHPPGFGWLIKTFYDLDQDGLIRVYFTRFLPHYFETALEELEKNENQDLNNN